MRFILSCLLPWLTEPYDYPSWCVILVFSVHVTGAAIFIFEWLSPRGLNRGTTTMRGNGEVNPAVWRWSTHSFLFFFLFITNIYVWLSILDSDKNVLVFLMDGGWMINGEGKHLFIHFIFIGFSRLSIQDVQFSTSDVIFFNISCTFCIHTSRLWFINLLKYKISYFYPYLKIIPKFCIWIKVKENVVIVYFFNSKHFNNSYLKIIRYGKKKCVSLSWL